MEYIKKLILSFREIFIMLILQYVVLFICFICFGVDNSIIIGTIFICIVEIIYVIVKIRGKKMVLDRQNLFPYVLLGIGTAVSYNMLLFLFELGNEVTVDMNIFLNVIASGIVGPIFEEVLFRYSFINYLEKFNSKIMIIIISSLVFAMCHQGITTIVFAFIIGMINSYLYLKRRNILIPITIHISANVIVNLLNCYNLYILIIGCFLIILSIVIIRNSKI